jgi:hypothetical protein
MILSEALSLVLNRSCRDDQPVIYELANPPYYGAG